VTSTKPGKDAMTPLWGDDIPARRRTATQPRVEVEHLVAVGVDVEDVEAYRDVLVRKHRKTATLSITADAMGRDLRLLAGQFPTLTVAAAVGWVLACRSVSDLPLGWGSSATARAQARLWDVEVARVVAPWVEDGQGEDGWLFWGAGLSPAEASAQVAAGAVDKDALLVLAALRGADLPAAFRAPVVGS
jgi:hypothetical protein